MAARASAFRPADEPLIQIRRGYTTDCGNLRLSVEYDAGGWIATVRALADGRTLHSAGRQSLGAGKIAAVEFAEFRSPDSSPRTSSEELAKRLSWTEYW